MHRLHDSCSRTESQSTLQLIFCGAEPGAWADEACCRSQTQSTPCSRRLWSPAWTLHTCASSTPSIPSQVLAGVGVEVGGNERLQVQCSHVTRLFVCSCASGRACADALAHKQPSDMQLTLGFSAGFQEPTYILKSTHKVTTEQIQRVLPVRHMRGMPALASAARKPSASNIVPTCWDR